MLEFVSGVVLKVGGVGGGSVVACIPWGMRARCATGAQRASFLVPVVGLEAGGVLHGGVIPVDIVVREGSPGLNTLG